jgi:hypothetical protein
MFDSFKNDDEELCTYALESCLADVQDRVQDGVTGAPFSIGDFGFYAANQYEHQAGILQANERKSTSTAAFLSVGEWETVDRKLLSIATHGPAR